MGKRWMRCLLAVGLLGGLAGVGGPGASASAAPPVAGGHVATQLQTVSAAVQPGDSYALVCGFADFPRDAYVMVHDTFTPTTGAAFSGVSRFSGADGEVRVTGKVSKFHWEQYPTDEGRTPGIFGSPGVATSAGVISKSWAIWTTTGSCTFSVNGVDQAITNLDPARARIVSLAEFGDGASLQIDPVVAAGALLNHDQASSGHLTAILDVSSASGASALLDVVGPEGQRYQAVTFNPFVWVDAPATNGTWSYTVTGVQSTPHFPALWTMELPVS